MELDPRKSRILTCVVESYIRTGEPIGSKMIAAMLEDTVSSATVRNDLAYLGEQGYRVAVGEFCPRALTPRNLLLDARLDAGRSR